jgi:hypothetical protein
MAAPPGWDRELWIGLANPVGLHTGMQAAGLEAGQASLLTGQESTGAAVVWTTLGGEVLLRPDQTQAHGGQASCATRAWDSPVVRPTVVEQYPVRPGGTARHERPELVRVSATDTEHLLVGMMPGDVLTLVSVTAPDGRRGERVELLRAERSLSLVREPGLEKLCYTGGPSAEGEPAADTEGSEPTER